MKRTLACLLTVLLLVSLTACGKSPQAPADSPEQPQAEAPAAPEAVYPLTVTDMAGR